MAEYESREQEQKRKALEKKESQESYDRLTAVWHLQTEHYSRHIKIEGYHEDRDVGHLFGCDRLMKIETLYGRVQMGYNPNRGKSFIFANIKTSRYDTAASRYQKELKEYQMKSLLKGQNQNRAYVARRWAQSAVLLEKSEAMPWTERSVKPYYGRVNMEALRKTLPFFAREEEQRQILKLKSRQKELKELIRENSVEHEFDKNRELNKEAVEVLHRDNFIQSLLHRKEMGSKYFLRRINYAFDIQKKEMFDYYRNQESKKSEQQEHAADSLDDTEDEI